MTTTAKKSAAEFALPDGEKAAEVSQQLFNEVYFEKLAAFGFEPRSPEEAQAYLRLADKALTIAQHPAVKQAELANSPVLRLDAQLEQFMTSSGLNKQAAAQKQSAHINQLALAYASNPEVYAAMLALDG
jgi:hypothetical protein